MPLASFAHYLSSGSPTEGLYTVAKWGALLAVVASLRAWSKGYVCKEERELAGKTYIIAGGLSGTGLAVFHYLAARGAQVVALHPGEVTPAVLELLLLLRSTTENERLYADQCDLTSLDSIRAFVVRWRKDTRAGMVGDLEVRLDGILFLDGEEEGAALPFGRGQTWAPQRGAPDERLSKHRLSRLTGRHALVQLMVPILLRSATTSTSPLRIISTVSPFYAAAAAAPARFRPLDFDYTQPDAGAFPRRSPWVAEGQIALASVLLWREFQARLSTLSAPSSSTSSSAPTPTATPAAAAAAAPILALSVCPGLTRASLRALIAPSLRSPARLAAYVLLWPLIWLLAKSADEAAQGVLGALMGEVEGWREAEKAARGPDGEAEGGKDGEKEVGKKGKEKEDDKGRRMRVRGGALYREGREVRIPALDVLPPSVGASLWDSECKLVERLLLAAAEAEKSEEKEGSPAGGGEAKKDV
ncbi:hypothetical protein JCM10449v2_007054 [Rhodotorula kratochvilovae]